MTSRPEQKFKSVEILAEEDGRVTGYVIDGEEHPAKPGHYVETLEVAKKEAEAQGRPVPQAAAAVGMLGLMVGQKQGDEEQTTTRRLTRRSVLQRVVLGIGGMGLYVGLRNLHPSIADVLPAPISEAELVAAGYCTGCYITYPCGSCCKYCSTPGRWRRTFVGYYHDQYGNLRCYGECSGYCTYPLSCSTYDEL